MDAVAQGAAAGWMHEYTGARERNTMGWLGGVFDSVQQWLFESVLQPLMFTTGLASLLENG